MTPFVNFFEIFQRIKFWKEADRIGPDIPYTHWRLHFKTTMHDLCKRKFKYFDDNAEFRPGAYAVNCSKISIGRNVVIRPGVMLFADPKENAPGITIEDNVLIGSGVHMYVVNHKFDNPFVLIKDQGHEPGKEIILKEGCWIGANTIILPGVTIGRNSIVGAGSVVTKSLPDQITAAGNPAKIVRYLLKGKNS